MIRPNRTVAGTGLTVVFAAAALVSAVMLFASAPQPQTPFLSATQIISKSGTKIVPLKKVAPVATKILKAPAGTKVLKPVEKKVIEKKPAAKIQPIALPKFSLPKIGDQNAPVKKVAAPAAKKVAAPAAKKVAAPAAKKVASPKKATAPGIESVFGALFGGPKKTSQAQTIIRKAAPAKKAPAAVKKPVAVLKKATPVPKAPAPKKTLASFGIPKTNAPKKVASPPVKKAVAKKAFPTQKKKPSVAAVKVSAPKPTSSKVSVAKSSTRSATPLDTKSLAALGGLVGGVGLVINTLLLLGNQVLKPPQFEANPVIAYGSKEERQVMEGFYPSPKINEYKKEIKSFDNAKSVKFEAPRPKDQDRAPVTQTPALKTEPKVAVEPKVTPAAVPAPVLSENVAATTQKKVETKAQVSPQETTAAVASSGIDLKTLAAPVGVLAAGAALAASQNGEGAENNAAVPPSQVVGSEPSVDSKPSAEEWIGAW
eukprot:CAMPEP_0114527642 /NCGR_PEP_ID=MMETSP0109-20121206/23739_1 /TAXON_ID=29199 /ORGANISM="Chlorarachnion reptans, Strain CCCM449" /LENGTH=482 /DNA_ID=CAMNT_0001709649 /DNA_START=20 /DNA_END=1465 /DNA_ORIENTATION=+